MFEDALTTLVGNGGICLSLLSCLENNTNLKVHEQFLIPESISEVMEYSSILCVTFEDLSYSIGSPMAF